MRRKPYIIYYTWNGIKCQRQAPVKRKQTAGSIVTSNRFGLVSRMGKSIRESLVPLLPPVSKKWLMHQLNRELIHWMENLDAGTQWIPGPLPGFHRFSLSREALGLSHLCPLAFSLQWIPGDKVLLNIPAFVPAREIKAPLGTTQVKLHFMLLQAETSMAEVTAEQTAVIDLRYDNDLIAAQEINFPWQSATGSISLYAIAIQYFNHGIQVTQEKYCPAMVWEGWG